MCCTLAKFLGWHFGQEVLPTSQSIVNLCSSMLPLSEICVMMSKLKRLPIPFSPHPCFLWWFVWQSMFTSYSGFYVSLVCEVKFCITIACSWNCLTRSYYLCLCTCLWYFWRHLQQTVWQRVLLIARLCHFLWQKRTWSWDSGCSSLMLCGHKEQWLTCCLLRAE